MANVDPKHKISAVIFDLDGLLLDTEPIYLEAYSKVCEKYGKDYSLDVRINVIGRGELLGAKKIVEMLELPLTPEKLLEERDVFLEVLLPEAKLMKGAHKLTKHLSAHKIPIAVATSSVEWSVKLKFQNHKNWIDSVFGTNIITGDNPKIKQGKPAPDIFLAAADLLGVDPKQCLVFEDSPSGVQAGKAAGMVVCSVPDPTMHKTSPDSFAIADYILESLEAFEPANFSLPFYLPQ